MMIMNLRGKDTVDTSKRNDYDHNSLCPKDISDTMHHVIIKC